MKDFAELLLREFEPQVFKESNNIAEDDQEEGKRSFFKSKKQPIPDFPLHIFSEWRGKSGIIQSEVVNPY